MSHEDGTSRPTLRIVRGDATPEEIAAIVALLGARSGGSTEQAKPARPVGGWADPRRLARPPIHTGPGAWRTAAW